jgi:hypothetical protein
VSPIRCTSLDNAIGSSFPEHSDFPFAHPFDPLSAPHAGLERICKVLCFPCNLVAAELHDADGVGRPPVIRQNILGDSEITAANDSPHSEALFARLIGARDLYVAPTADPARLTGGILMQDIFTAVTLLDHIDIVIRNDRYICLAKPTRTAETIERLDEDRIYTDIVVVGPSSPSRRSRRLQRILLPLAAALRLMDRHTA